MRRNDPLLRSPQHGAKLLKAWLARTGLSQAAAARVLGVSQAAVCDWLHQKKLPIGLYRQALETWTSGAVPAWSWVDREERELEKRLADVQPYQQPEGSQ